MDNRADLAGIGWSEWFEAKAARQCAAGHAVARVAAVDRDQVLLLDGSGPFRARLSGSYLYAHPLPMGLPCVGDWVCVGERAAGGAALIHARLDRRTALRRRSVGEAAGCQTIAANVDTVIIVQSCHFDFNVRRLERYLVMVRDGGAEPRILLTKMDLVDRAVLASQREEIRAAGIGAPLLTLSNVTQEGVDELLAVLEPGRTYCFVGSSGVGKSTIINRLLGREALQTRGVSGTGEGRHTTVRRELIVLEGGALVIDNPGMREFGVLGVDDGSDGGFPDIVAAGAGCRYRDCTHTREPGCAVLRALQSGDIARDHYESYLKLRDESEFYELSHAERRKKDRAFGRFLKSAKKDLEGE